MFALIQPNANSTKVETAAMKSPRYSRLTLTAVPLGALLLISGCEELTKNTESVLLPNFQRSDLFGFVAGMGTTFAVLRI
jgi:hypothetical protein